MYELKTSRVILTDAEMEIAILVGRRRYLSSLARGSKHLNGKALYENDWDMAIEGAAGELAFCKARGIYFEASVDTFHAPDAEGIWQIRTTRRLGRGLIMRKGDPPADLYVLVEGQCPRYTIRGWIRGSDGMVPANWTAPDPKRAPCWVVPVAALVPFRIGGLEELQRNGAPARPSLPASVVPVEPAGFWDDPRNDPGF